MNDIIKDKLYSDQGTFFEILWLNELHVIASARSKCIYERVIGLANIIFDKLRVEPLLKFKIKLILCFMHLKFHHNIKFVIRV